jgi:hypothetical protein
MLRLELQPDLEAQLAQEAESLGLTIERYIERIVEARPAVPAIDRAAVVEAVARIRELRKGNRLDGLKIKDLIHEGRKY